MAPSLDQTIRARIDAFAQELSQLVKQAALEAVHGVLGTGGSSAPARAGRPRAARGAPRGGRGKRSSEQVLAAAASLFDYVRRSPGQTLEGIAKGLKTHTKGLKLPIAKLLETKKIRKTGAKRGTKYFPR